MVILPKAIYRFNVIPIKIPMSFFTSIEKSIYKFMWKHKRPQIAKAILSKKSNARSITISDFKLYSRVRITRIAWRYHKNRQVDQWNRMKDPEISQHSYSHLIFDKGAKNVGENHLFKKWCWGNWISTFRKLKQDPYHSLCTKINSKWIKDLNVRSNIRKLLRENKLKI
jgi:hypothetical protein